MAQEARANAHRAHGALVGLMDHQQIFLQHLAMSLAAPGWDPQLFWPLTSVLRAKPQAGPSLQALSGFLLASDGWPQTGQCGWDVKTHAPHCPPAV